MREYKFRAWVETDNFNERGIYTGFSFKDIDSGREEANAWCDDDKVIKEPDWDKIKIMQFTGLKDSKGVDIYEGDILQFKYFITRLKDNPKGLLDGPGLSGDEPIMVKDYTNEVITNVEVKIPDIYFELRDRGKHFEDESEIYKAIEIIGNRFENPKLMEEKNAS